MGVGEWKFGIIVCVGELTYGCAVCCGFRT